MSLYIVGSCSRITRNIVLELAKQNQYKSITIGDNLLCYDLHNRFYDLKRELSQAKSTTQVNLDKLIHPSQLYKAINSENDVLFVTHDYYENVSSKTKLMKLVAQYGKKKTNLHFATPLQYDHYGFNNPQQHYIKTQQQVIKIAPQSSIIRSDIQDKTEFFGYYNFSKNFWQDQLLKLSVKKGFSPRVASATLYAQTVAQQLANKTKGNLLLIRGDKQIHPQQVDFNRTLSQHDWSHAKANVRNIASKYTGIMTEGKSTVTV